MGSGKPNNLVGSRVRQSRQRRKPLLTQLGLCGQLAKCGAPIDRASISKIEMGTRFVLDYEVVALAKVLGVSVGWLLGGKGKS